ncbi:MAG: phosphoribosylglycinamide formyltransferase [Cyanobacteria bacterium P01_H01_bin.15]
MVAQPILDCSLPPLPRPVRLGILASGNGTNFQAIAESVAADELNAEIAVLIYNNPDAHVKERAAQFGVPTIFLDHRQKSRARLDQEIVDTLKTHNVELVAMAGWMRIVSAVLINAFANRIVNIHPSLLPQFKGLDAVSQALAAGVPETGCTAHIVVEAVDSGPILLQAAVPIKPEDDEDRLHNRIREQEYRIFPRALAIAAKRFVFEQS